jgi:signal transduction histidine kinase
MPESATTSLPTSAPPDVSLRASRPLRRLGPHHYLLMIGALLIVIILSLAVGFLWHLRTTQIDTAEKDISNLGAVLAEQTAQTLHGVELVLDSVEERLKGLDLRNPADAQMVHLMLRERIGGVPQISRAVIVGADGNVLVSSRVYPAPPNYLGGYDYFKMHRDQPATRLTISEPIRGRLTGEWMILVTRRLDAPDGSFAGVLEMVLTPSYFESVYRSATLNDGTAITLCRDDGILLARYPSDESVYGTSFANGPIFSRLPSLRDGEIVRFTGFVDGITRYYAPRRVRGYPLVVAPSISEGVILAGWYRETLFVGSATIAAALGIFVLLMLLRANEERLRNQASVMSTLIENLPIGASLVGPDLRHVAFNRLYLDLFNLTPDMLKIGDPFARLIRYSAERGEYGDGDIDAQIRQRVDRAVEPHPDKFERRRPDGQVLEIRRMPLPGGGFVTTYIDVTEARRRERDIETARIRLERQAIEVSAAARKLDAARIEAERARAAADAANAAKSLFLANMSHELRTPLNAILGFSEVTRDALFGPLDARYREYARDVHASGQYLLRLINDVLDTSKIEVGRMELSDEPIDIAEIIRECQRLVLDKAHDRGVALTAHVPTTLPFLRGDRLRIKQILLNLLSNAVKFTRTGGQVRISVTLPAKGGLEIAVADSGIGMRPEDIPVALEPFRQVDNSFTRRYEGTGLGLPLAKTLTELHGGRLTLESEIDKGTTARVWLPPDRLTPASLPEGAAAPNVSTA